MPLSTTEEIKSKLDIADVIRDYIELKQAGSTMKARCPFHNEKTPSFVVSRERQMYHCFGCGEHGDIFSFVMKMEGIEFPEALRILAKRAGVEIKNEDPRMRNERTKLQDILKFSTRFFQEHLRVLPESHPVAAYIASRGLTPNVIDTFQIGFAPDTWDSLLSALQKKNVDPRDAQNAGIIMRSEDGRKLYDRFRGRLMFPIADAHGNVVGFGGRTIPSLQAQTLGKEPAKYINTPQTPLYNKSGVLYGLHLAKSAIRTEKKIVVVEGYMDCIAAHTAGTAFTVASSGTAFTNEQAKLIKRFTDTVVLAFDMDAAGIEASGRGVDVLLGEGLTVRIASLPQGKDPDELIRKDAAAWKSAIEKPELFMEFAFTQTMKGKNIASVEDKKEVAKKLLPIITRIANQIEQTHYLQKLGVALGVEEQVLRGMLTRTMQPGFKATPKGVQKHTQTTGHAAAIQELVSIIFNDPTVLPFIKDNLSVASLPPGPYTELYKLLIYQYTEKQTFSFPDFRAFIETEHPDLLSFVDICELGASQISEHADRQAKHIVHGFMQDYLRASLKAISAKIAEAETTHNPDSLKELTQQFEHITHDLKRFTS